MAAPPPETAAEAAAGAEPRLVLAAVVVTYNRLAPLQVTLARLLAEDLDHLLVVDNASTDGTADWLESQTDPRIRLLRLPENRGGAGGFEAGLAAVTEHMDPDWTVLMDDDARPKAGALAAFRREAAGIDPDAGREKGAPGVIAAAVFLPSGRICEMNRPSRNPFWHMPELIRTLTGRGRRGFHLPNAALARDAAPTEIDVASFVGFFVSRGAVARGGLPEGGLFIYGDDVIYSLRLRRAGLRLALHPAVRFEHDCGTLGTGLVTRPLWKVYYLSRNGVALARVAAGPLLFPAALLWYLVAWTRKEKHYDPTERALYRSLMWEGVRDGLLWRRGRKAAIHERVARDERRVALMGGSTENGRPFSMTTAGNAKTSGPDISGGPAPDAKTPEPAARPAAGKTAPPALKAVSAPPPPGPVLARPQPAAVPPGPVIQGPKPVPAPAPKVEAPKADKAEAPAPAPAPAPQAKPAAAPAKAAPLPQAKPAAGGQKRSPVARPARMMPRHRGILATFGLVVCLPVLATASYLYLVAADQYASTTGFTVRSEDISSAVDILGGLGGSLGGSGSRDSDILYEFIRSQELVALVDARVDLRRLYSRHVDSDPLMGFSPDGTIEDLTSYWQRMVRISYDAGAGLMELRVLAFEPDEAKAIADAIFDESSKMINALSAIAREDATRYAREDLDTAVERLKHAREALTAFRIQHQIVDPAADIQGQMGLLNTLQGQLAEALIELDLLTGTTRDDDPRLTQTKRRIEVIEARIADERRKFGAGGQGPGGENYAVTVADFERLTVDRQFAERGYTAAQAAYDGAIAEANRQSRYLAAYIRPTLAEKSEFPQRGLTVGLVALFSFLAWAIMALIYYSLRDRR
jgi:capsular polysaccharide transport system permease protein